MFSGYNVFAPEDLDLAESILDEVWQSFPEAAREGPRAKLLREQLARQVLAAMTKDHADRKALKAALMSADVVTDWSWRCDDTPLSGTRGGL
ncbi:hypothetical protein [Hyphomicrobium sp.]|jgi:hypothetical protein|uniref:hypothetical protein n=1 Tax=Hyphomicrobium sp. TaxID=82 RepID=UPI002C6822C5|nr:hypothetical protein [Hyphomicrobium sp.]HVZ05094.1 hypothetical protein [Hyphomicrobium sp.]